MQQLPLVLVSGHGTSGLEWSMLVIMELVFIPKMLFKTRIFKRHVEKETKPHDSH